MLPQCLGEAGANRDVAPSVARPRFVLAAAIEAGAHPHAALVEVDVLPSQGDEFADPEPGIREHPNQETTPTSRSVPLSIHCLAQQ